MFHDFSRLPDFFKVKTKPDMGGLKYRPVVSWDENARRKYTKNLKLTAFLPLKIHGWKMKFPFRECLFSGVTLLVSQRVHVTQLSIKEAH